MVADVLVFERYRFHLNLMFVEFYLAGQLLALPDITTDRLKNFTGIDAFIQVACPRISTDNEFDKPMLSTPQANALLKLLKKEKIDNYLEIPHWL